MAHQGTSDRIAPELSFAASIGWLRVVLVGVRDVIAGWRRQAADRQHLATLSDYYLKDIGLSRPHDPRADRAFWYP